MLNLQRVAQFVAVVEAGGFTAAAQSMQQTKAAISFNVRQLEAELGVSLLVRSTRRVALTQAGEVFYQRALQLLRESEALVEDVQGHHGGFSGELSISTTPEYGQAKVIPALSAFGRLHPGLTIRHESSSAPANLISGQFDVAIRLGKLADSSYRAALIERFEIVAVAAPQWLERNPIGSLEALAEAEWVIHRRLPTPREWQVIGPDQETRELTITGPARFMTDTAAALMAFVVQGCGVGLLPEWLVRNAIECGELQHLLPEYRFPSQGIYAVYPNTKHVPAKVRALIDFLQQWENNRPA
ncbi:LysR family transcriptional regulator [Enterobacter sp. Ap-1006]|uniref:LysR family transcriptional regulator n=1 Tax=Enterobacter sp. Ap-1006 TaxID=2608345 RepID=UPI0014243D8C|nr:LysR family transcriptional regulator [Enterobacter sp. Ap-1006]NIF46769.1 LysR family transcriptional regulator [Enterobacter sp. Ap-1006]